MTENLLASGVAVVGATVFTHPIDVVKVQLQMAEKSCAKADSFSELVALWWLCAMLCFCSSEKQWSYFHEDLPRMPQPPLRQIQNNPNTAKVSRVLSASGRSSSGVRAQAAEWIFVE